ncbi:MAG: hypothetical protein CMJ59_19705 [Planctomycetaceae bacterium]|nr:hypothetical protein [Planctomycetaceae bacterium]
MKCPRDGTELASVSVAGVELDKCHQCDGIWFDERELEVIRKLDLGEIEEQLEREFGRNPEYREGETDGYMRCPRCASDDGRLQQHHFSYVVPVKIDRCQTCQGIWLDDNELDKVMDDKKQLNDAYSVNKLAGFMRHLEQDIARMGKSKGGNR